MHKEDKEGIEGNRETNNTGALDGEEENRNDEVPGE